MSTKSKVIFEEVVKGLDKEFKKRYKNANHLEVGFLKGKYPSGIPVASVASFNEFGTLHTPPRPFFRNAITKNKAKWIKFVKSNLSTGVGVYKSLSMAGELMRGDVVKSLTATSTPPNAPATILKKGSSHPLIDTGFMRASVTYEIKG